MDKHALNEESVSQSWIIKTDRLRLDEGTAEIRHPEPMTNPKPTVPLARATAIEYSRDHILKCLLRSNWKSICGESE